jgi:hypothetical protein
MWLLYYRVRIEFKMFFIEIDCYVIIIYFYLKYGVEIKNNFNISPFFNNFFIRTKNLD